MRYVLLLLQLQILHLLSAQPYLYEAGGDYQLIRDAEIQDSELGMSLESNDYFETDGFLTVKLSSDGSARFSAGSKFALDFRSDRSVIVLLTGTVFVETVGKVELQLYTHSITSSESRLYAGIGMNSMSVVVLDGMAMQQAIRRSDPESQHVAVTSEGHKIDSSAGLLLYRDGTFAPLIAVASGEAGILESFQTWRQNATYALTAEQKTEELEQYQKHHREFFTSLHRLNKLARDIISVMDKEREFATPNGTLMQIDNAKILQKNMYHLESQLEHIALWQEVPASHVHIINDAQNDYQFLKEQFAQLRYILKLNARP